MVRIALVMIASMVIVIQRCSADQIPQPPVFGLIAQKLVFEGLRYLSISSIKELVSLERSWRALSSLEIRHLACLIFTHLNIVGTECQCLSTASCKRKSG